MLPFVCEIMPATPSFPLPPMPVGQLTDFPAPTVDFHVGLTAAR